MPNRRARRRSQLFDLYSKNLAFFDGGEFAGRFVCPICSLRFCADAVRPPNPALDLAHVYPESTGATLETLTCKNCNSRMGHRYDHHLSMEHRFQDAMKGGKPYPARMAFEGGSAGIEFSHNEGRVEVKVIGAQTDPNALTLLVAGLQTPDFKFDIEHRYCEPVRHKVALLHAAHLALFKDFGYEYLFEVDAQWIRDVLTSDEPPKELPRFLTFHAPLAWQTRQFDDRLMFRSGVAIANGIRCLVVIFPATNAKNVGRCVLLPGLGSDGKAAYQALSAQPDGGRINLRTSVCVFPAHPRLIDPKRVAYLRHLWESDF
jgi:hypothetical protein